MSDIELYRSDKINDLSNAIANVTGDFLSYSGDDIREDDIGSNDFDSLEEDFIFEFVDKVKPVVNAFVDNYLLHFNNESFSTELLIQETESSLSSLIHEHFQQIYVCTRVWSAWSYGTMTEEDFTDVCDDTDLVHDIISSVMNTYFDLQALAEKNNITQTVFVDNIKIPILSRL